MSDSYSEFLATRRQVHPGDGFEPTWLPDWLFGFQHHLTDWAIRQGRAAVLADCGLGKTPIELVWATNVYRHTGRPVLILTPLAVSFQTEREAVKFGIDAAVSRDGSLPAPVTITNYERLDRFQPDQLGGVVCDESSILKAFDGTRRAQITEFLRTVPYRLLATATAAPNDYIELGTSSEALGHLGYMDMLNRFFVNDQRTSATNRYRGQAAAWRFKGHAQQPFWRWVATWAKAARKPSDLGYPDDGFHLPALHYRQHLISVDRPREDGALFDLPATGLREERAESRHSLRERCAMAADLLVDAKTAVAWCHLNDESKLLTSLIDGAVELHGGETVEAKEEKLAAFSAGEIRVLVTKPKLASWGLNWQHCHRMTYFPSYSYEQHYQAVRRCWRYGQTQPVTVDIVTTEGGASVLGALRRKAEQADVMFSELVAHMRHATELARVDRYHLPMEAPRWGA